MSIQGRLLSVIALLFLFAFTGAAQGGDRASPGIEGIWQGGVPVKPNLEITVVFHVSARPDGTLAATMDVPDQNARGIPVDGASFEEGLLRLEVGAVGGVFEGRLSEDGAEITGQWIQESSSLPLVLKRVEKAPEGPRRPQLPERPYPYDDEEVAFRNEAAGIPLRGTLTLPRSEGPVAAVVLITGGGAEDRDQTVLGHKPYLVLADYLTRRGIAVLRADDRGYEKARGQEGLAEFLEATSADFAGDALAGVEYLKTRGEVDPKRIGLIGSSEGGLVAALAAVQSQDVAFIVLLGAPGQTLEELLLDQIGFILGDSGGGDALTQLAQDHFRRAFEVLRRPIDAARADQELLRLEEDDLAELGEPEREKLKSLDRTMGGNPIVRRSPWFRYLLRNDPEAAYRKVRCPVLALAGEKDVQVPAERNLPRIEKALDAGGNARVVARVMPGLNHMFQTCETGSPREYARIEETFSPTALTVVGDWIVDLTSSGSSGE